MFPGKGVAPSPTPLCCSFPKGSLRATLDYGRQLYMYLKAKNGWYAKKITKPNQPNQTYYCLFWESFLRWGFLIWEWIFIYCQKIAVSIPTQVGQRFTRSKTLCDRQQLWKAVITGDTVTRLRIPILKKARVEIWQKRSEKKQQKLPRWRQKVCNK